MRPILELIFGLAWTRGRTGWPMAGLTIAALLAAGAASAFSVSIWPPENDPRLEPAGSPGVVRNGQRLEFVGKVPWVGRQKETGARISFGDAPPDGTPPESWFHYGPDAVINSSPRESGTFAPLELEWKIRSQIAALTISQDLLVAAVMFFALTMLLRVKGVELSAYGPLRALGQCLVPACVWQAAVLLLGSRVPESFSFLALVLVLGTNALFFVLGAQPTPDEAPAFDV